MKKNLIIIVIIALIVKNLIIVMNVKVVNLFIKMKIGIKALIMISERQSTPK
jgi:hypothetical protein